MTSKPCGVKVLCIRRDELSDLCRGGEATICLLDPDSEHPEHLKLYEITFEDCELCANKGTIDLEGDGVVVTGKRCPECGGATKVDWTNDHGNDQ